MENENKTQNAAQDGKRRDNHRKKGHKPKSYFMTPPSPAQAEKQEALDKAPSAPEKAPAPASNQGQSHNNNQKNNQNNRNKKKHKRNNDKSREASQNQTNQPSASNREQATSVPAPASKSDRLEMMPTKKAESVSDREKYADYDEFSYEEIYGDNSKSDAVPSKTETEDISAPQAPSLENPEDEVKVEVVGIKFKESGKTYYFAPAEFKLHVGQHVIVKTTRGLEYGEVALANTMVNESETVPPLRSVARIATPADIKHHEENKEKENEAFRICNEKIIAHKLDMKLIDAQYTFDNSKLLFYFTSSGRVDFRDLVKDLAAVFRTRIELRQIGIRDEAKMIGGLGMCGRSLCCSMFLTDFGQVSIKMAKEQNLSLNSAKISGNCGRLMCCLRYEQETYDYEIKHTPPVDTLVRTVDGIGTVCEISPLAGTVKVRLSAQPDVPPKSYKREELKILKKKQ